MSLFDWDVANRNHLARHSVTVASTEQASLGFVMELDSYIVDHEHRLEEVGQTHAGRILKLVSVVRAKRLRILTAYDAPSSLKKLFLKSKVNL